MLLCYVITLATNNSFTKVRVMPFALLKWKYSVKTAVNNYVTGSNIFTVGHARMHMRDRNYEPTRISQFYTHTLMHTSRTHTCAQAHSCMHAHSHACILACSHPCSQVLTHRHSRSFTQNCAHNCMHVYMHLRTCLCVHTHACTHAHANNHTRKYRRLNIITTTCITLQSNLENNCYWIATLNSMHSF